MKPQVCEPHRLDAYLCGELPGQEESTLISHLDHCANCRTAIERRAGDAQVWHEAQELLTGWRLHLTTPASSHAAGVNSAAIDSEVAEDECNEHEIQRVQDALAPTDDPCMLGRLGAYEISGIVGSGGMGVVLKAHDRTLDRIVAIKVMAPHLASSGSARKRFSREGKAAAAVLHPNVIPIHCVSNDGTLPYLVMPYFRGESLQKRLDREGSFPVSEVLRIGAQIAAGLAAAHAQGLVHRDIKPANVLLEEGVERVAITDFGLARAIDDATMTRSGVIAGTPQYMSPEQARGETIDGRSDLFSLGSLLYAMCAGHAPFRAETTFGVLQRINQEEPRSIRDINPEIPSWLCGVIEKLMSKRPVDRFESAEQVAELLEECLAHVQQPTVVTLPVDMAPKNNAKSAQRSSQQAPIFLKPIGVITMIATACLALSGLLGIGVMATAPGDIAGSWMGDEWGVVELREMKPGNYQGTYTDAFDGEKGSIKLKWSRVERRYHGTWAQGTKRFGKISVRRVGKEIRGAWSASKNAEIEPGIPRLSDLSWTRYSPPTFNQEQGAQLAAAGGFTSDEASDKQPPFENSLKLEFHNAPWKDVLQFVAQQTERSIDFDYVPSGTFSFKARRSYTPNEVVSILNETLYRKGYNLVRGNRKMYVIDLEDSKLERVRDVLPLTSLSQLGQRADFEFIKCQFDVSSKMLVARGEISQLLGPHGSMVVIPAAQRVVITDIARNVRTIHELLVEVAKKYDPESSLLRVSTDADSSNENRFTLDMLSSRGVVEFASGEANTRHAPLVRLQVDEDVANVISPGQRAIVKIDALPNMTYRGRVTSIIKANGQTETRDIVVALETWPESIKQKLTATIEIEAGED